MSVEIPNPCDGVVDPGPDTEETDDHLQGAQDVISLPPAEEQPQQFSVRTIQEPTIRAGRSLSMFDEEFFLPVLPPRGPAHGIYTPSWYYYQKIREATLRAVRDTGSFDAARIDPIRAGLLNVWTYFSSPLIGEISLSYFVNPGSRPDSFNIPVETTIGQPFEQNDETLSSVGRLDFGLNDHFARHTTNQYSSFQNSRRFFNVYMFGQEAAEYSTLDQETKDAYKYGFLPPEGASYRDSVFDHPLPFHESETNFLNAPAFNVVDISLESRGFLTEAFGSGKIVSEYQKPSIYRSFFEDKNLENLELSVVRENVNRPCIPLDRVQKFPSDKVELMETANEKLERQSESFVRIKIATTQGQDNFIAQLLRNNKMDRHILDLIASGEQQDQEVFTQVMNDAVYTEQRYMTDSFTSNDRSRQGVMTKVNNNFITKISEQANFVGERIQNITQYPLGYFNYDRPLLLSFEDAITSQIFLSEVKEYVKTRNYSRMFEELLIGKKAHSEIIAYHVEKADAQTGEVIQDFYFSDSNEVLEIDFVDNQILLGKKYRYRVYAVNIVLAMEYRYGAPIVNANRGSDNHYVELPVNTDLKYSIIETPYFEKVLSVFDKPPMFPQVSFIPYQGVEDEIGFLLQDNGGEVLELPITIREEDVTAAELMAEAQNKVWGPTRKDKLLYGSDDLPTGFEILCIDESELFAAKGRKEPYSYEDFDIAEIKRIPANGKTGFFKKSIKPNVYYYIVFRTVEEEMISNPTEVFRFMMVSYENGIFMDIQTIELEPPKEMEKISFEKILKIEPNMEQRFLKIGPADSSAQALTSFRMSAPALTKSDIGKSSTALWDKKIKIRLKSRSTGKEIDVKVVFKKEVLTLLRRNDDPVVEPIPEVCDV